MRDRKIVDSVFIKRLQNLNNYDTLNSLNLKADQGKLLIFIEMY